MSLGFIIAGVFALMRIIRVRRSGVTRTAIVGFACLLLGTACEVVIIFMNEFGMGDAKLLAGVVSQIMVETALSALPFTGGVIGAQWLRGRIGV